MTAASPASPCSRCDGPRDRPYDRYCAECRRKYRRERDKRMARALHLCERFNLSVEPVSGKQLDTDAPRVAESDEARMRSVRG